MIIDSFKEALLNGYSVGRRSRLFVFTKDFLVLFLGLCGLFGIFNLLFAFFMWQSPLALFDEHVSILLLALRVVGVISFFIALIGNNRSWQAEQRNLRD